MSAATFVHALTLSAINAGYGHHRVDGVFNTASRIAERHMPRATPKVPANDA